jgi:putative PIN family toxin of toxin-antitoxin system
MKPRVVLDTNVLVSGLLGGTATDVIRRWRAGDLQMVLSPEIMAEYEGVLSRPKFRLPKWVV